jgi:hypothetical protein
MTGLAASIAKSDPERAMECLEAHGEFGREMDDGRLSKLINDQGKIAAAESPEALGAFLARIPAVTSAVTTTSGNYLDLPEDADFAALQDVLRKDNEHSRKPLYLCGVMVNWAKQDEAAATDYLLNRGETDFISSEWGEVLGVIKDAKGQVDADRWVIDTLREVSVEKRGEFLKNTNYLYSPERIMQLDPALFAEGERAELAVGLLEGMAVSEMDLQGLLKMLPADEWAPALKGARGINATGQIEAYLREGGVRDADVTRIIQVVKQTR